MTRDGPRLSSSAVLRVAAWPIETVHAFSAAALAAAAATVHASERDICERRDMVCAELHRAVPRMPDRRVRAHLLAVMRAVHRGTAPLPAIPDDVARALASEPRLTAVLREEDGLRLLFARQRGAFEQAYDDELARQRHALVELSATPAFQRALFVANPVVARQSRSCPVRTRARPGRERRMEATLFHYLMRAAGRPTPHGAWAGALAVAPRPADAHDAPGIVVAPAPPRYRCTVDLQPFREMLRAFARKPRHARRRPLRLNPTLRGCDGGWCYERVLADGARRVVLPSHPLYEIVFRYFADFTARPAAPLLDACGTAASEDGRRAMEGLIARMVECDVLRSDVALPAAAPSVWKALLAAGDRLAGTDRRRWLGTVRRVRRLCAALGRAFDGLSGAEVEQRCGEIEQEVRTLWRCAGLTGWWPGPVVRVDMKPPFTATWDEASIVRLGDSVRSVLAFHAGDGGAELYRRLSLGEVLHACDGGRDVPLRSVLDRFATERTHDVVEGGGTGESPDDPDSREMLLGRFGAPGGLEAEIAAYCDRWVRTLEPVHRLRSHRLPPPRDDGKAIPGPAGSVLVRLDGEGACWIGPARPEPAIFAPRADRCPGGTAVVRECVRRAARAGVALAEVVGGDAVNLNAAVRDVACRATIEPHGPPDRGIEGLRLLLDAGDRRPWLRRDASAELLVPVYNGSAAMGFRDPDTRLLLTLARAHGWEYLSFGFAPPRAERTTWGHLPRLLLDEHTTLSPERWTIGGDAVARIAGLTGPARYLAWCGEVESRGLPNLVHVRCGPGMPDLLMVTDSPLAVRCLFDTVAVGAPWLSLTEVPGHPGGWPVRDAAGRHYASELALSWLDEGYWDAVTPARTAKE